MKYKNLCKGLGAITLLSIVVASCTKLEQETYSVVPNQSFWQTPAQIAAGVAPAYQALTGIPDGAVYSINTASSDEQLVPTRGNDWYDNGNWFALWSHKWLPTTTPINDAWNAIYNGIGRVNFTMSIVNNLSTKPANIDNINAELKTLRAYYYYLALDMFGNVPLVTNFNTPPDSVTNSTRQQVFTFVESELKSNIPLLSSNVDASTYGRVTKWMAFGVLAKLYLNAQVYTGTARWNDCIAACDSVISSGKYSLQTNYFDNFSVKNEGSVENIFVVPFDNVNIGGNGWQTQTLHYQNNINFQLTGSPNNGFCTSADFYNQFDTTSVYTVKGGNTYRTFLDARSGQYLVGQQFTAPFTYPPNQNVLYASQDPSLQIKDAQTNLPLSFNPNFNKFSDPSSAFRLAGVRNIKYFPEAGTSGNQSNDMVLLRLADIYLMKAEAEVRAGTNINDALSLVNRVRERAYGGDASHDWTIPNLTLDNILAERGRELAWEGWRRQDQIRFGKYGQPKNPDKPNADPTDGHLNIFPIPDPQIIANHNLRQNPGY